MNASLVSPRRRTVQSAGLCVGDCVTGDEVQGLPRRRAYTSSGSPSRRRREATGHVGDDDFGDLVGASVVGASVVGASVVGASVVGASVVGASVGATDSGDFVQGGVKRRAKLSSDSFSRRRVGATSHVGEREEGDTEVGAADVGAAEVGVADVGDIEVGAVEVGADVGECEEGERDVGDRDVGERDVGDRVVGDCVGIGQWPFTSGAVSQGKD